MALANPPIMVNGGDTDDQRVFHPAAAFRRANFARGGKQTGVSAPYDLVVRAGETPGPFVTVGPGSGVLTYAQGQAAKQDLAYAQAPNQSVDVYNDALTEVTVQPTTSAGGRTDLVVVEMVDPELEGTRDTTDFRTHQFQRFRVIQGVGNNVEHPWQLSTLGRPVLPLARIRIPASTQTIKNEMITDVRQMAYTNSRMHPLFGEIVTSGNQWDIPASQTSWLTMMTFSNIPVPSWATHCHLNMDLGPAYAVNGNVNGNFSVLMTGQYQPIRSTQTSFVEESAGLWNRFMLTTGGTIAIHQLTAGATAQVQVQLRRHGGAANGVVRFPGYERNNSFAKGWITFEEAPRFDSESGM